MVDDAAWFRDKLQQLGFTQTSLAQWMQTKGDDRSFDAILRSISRMATGDARVSGEMKALLGIYEQNIAVMTQFKEG
jgi:hypothetical protein